VIDARRRHGQSDPSHFRTASTADSPRDTLSPATLALHFPGGSIGLQARYRSARMRRTRSSSRTATSRGSTAGCAPARPLVLKDLSSTNGTYLDGARVAEAEIDAGARIRVGSAELRVERAGPRLEASLPGLIACDPALGPVLELLRRAAPSSLPVTILGESGTGKEVAARAVHELSHRRTGPSFR